MMTRQKNIRLTILRVLDDCGMNALPQSTLRDFVNDRCKPVPRTQEFQEAIDWLRNDSEREASIKTLGADMEDDEPRWLITEPGRVLRARNS